MSQSTDLQAFYMRNATLGEPQRYRDIVEAELRYLGKNYEGLADWDDMSKPLRKRKPRVIIPLFKEAVDSIGRFVWGGHRFPPPVIAATRVKDGEPAGDVGPILDKEQAQDLTQFLREVVKSGRLARVMLEATRTALVQTSAAIIVGVRNGFLSARVEDGKHCTPTWDRDQPGMLEQLEVRYQFPKEVEQGPGQWKVIPHWYRRVITRVRDIVYLEQPVRPNEQPNWVEDKAKSVDHGLGICPVRWLRTLPSSSDEVDGTPVIDPQLYPLIDDVNYTISQRSRSIKYVTDPQIVRTNVNQHDRDALNKAPGMPWDLPKDATVQLLELSGSGAEAASRHAEDLIRHFQNAVAYVKSNPDSTSGNISGVVLEFLHAPMISLAAELRDDLGTDGYCGLLALVMQMLCILDDRGEDVWIHGIKDACQVLRKAQKAGPWMAPAIVLEWAPFFAETEADKLAKVTYTATALEKKLIAGKTATASVAAMFSIVDAEVEQEEIAAESAEKQAEAMATLETETKITAAAKPPAGASAGPSPSKPPRR